MNRSPRFALVHAVVVVLLATTLASLAAPKPKRVLVVTTTTGFRHSSIETAERILEKLGRESGSFTVEYARVTPPSAPSKPGEPKDTGDAEKLKTDKAKYEAALEKFKADDALYQEQLKQYGAEQKRVLGQKMSATALKQYDAVIFANTTGDLPLPDPQAFIDWVKAGHGFVGMHSASDTFHGFRPFVEMIGGEFLTHGSQATVDCLNQDTKHAATRGLPATWTVYDEIYLFKSFTNTTVHELIKLDQEPNKKTPGEFPISWCKSFGKGRVFYTSLGHREDIWDADTPPGFKRNNTREISQAYQQHILGGIQWALGLAKGNAKPQAKPNRPTHSD
jgi:type 1 glutamine amidotransferase